MSIEKQHLNRTIRKVLGGVGNFSAAWVSFVNILGFRVHEFVSFNFWLHDYFLYFVCPSNRPSLTRKLLSQQTIIGDSRAGQKAITTEVCDVPSSWGPDFTPT